MTLKERLEALAEEIVPSLGSAEHDRAIRNEALAIASELGRLAEEMRLPTGLWAEADRRMLSRPHLTDPVELERWADALAPRKDT